MSRPKTHPPRLLRVLRSQQLSPSLRRIVLGGPELAGFPAQSEGAHIKLMLARPGQTIPVLPTLGPDGPIWPAPELCPIKRTYSVAAFDPQAGELSVDFVLHEHPGPAANWAQHAKIGDAIGVAGPACPPLFLANADFYLLAGDLSASPLIAAVLANLPVGARGLALIEINNPADARELARPAGVGLRWLLQNTTRASASRQLLDAVQATPWPEGQVSLTLAGESTQVVALRHYLMREHGLPRSAMYAVPYWKDQHDEEAYHVERHRIMDSFESELVIQESAQAS